MSMPPQAVHRIGITLGEPAGIGPDIVLMLAQKPCDSELVVIGCPTLLEQRAKQLGLNIQLQEVDFSAEPRKKSAGKINILPVPILAPCKAGLLNPENAPYVLETLKTAFFSCLSGQLQAIVTAPVHKGILHEYDNQFIGHTEYFAALANVQDVLMAFYSEHNGQPNLTGLVSTHIPLKEVPSFITPKRLEHAIRLMTQSLQTQFGIANPRLGILGLNPHAGENGALGQEEIEIMIPVIEKLKAEGFNLLGPLSGDTAFSAARRAELQYDGLLAMYHDQGLAPLKAQNFGQLVNVTLGLPIIRTSVDHGTALTIAGTQQASPASLEVALLLAQKLSCTFAHALAS